MRIAKTNHEEIDRLLNALKEVEWLDKELKNSYFEDVDFSDFEIMSKFEKTNPERFLTDLLHHLSAIHFQRILWNCKTLLDNCADPKLSHLDFNADIKAGLELLEKSKTPTPHSAFHTMSTKNSLIREHLAQTAEERLTVNRFKFGAIQIKIGPDSPLNEVAFEETITVSIYDPEKNIDVVFSAKIEEVTIIKDALK